MLRSNIERDVKWKSAKLWILFVDYANMFDTVNHNALWNTLKEFGVPKHLTWLMQKLYNKATEVICATGEQTHQFALKRGKKTCGDVCCVSAELNIILMF